MSSASDRRKSSGGDDAGGANWMDTYGDLVTLLLTFFVLLFSFSNIDAAKWEALVGSFQGMSVIGIEPISPEIAVADPIPRIGPMSAGQIESDAEDPAKPVSPENPEGGSENALADLYEIYEYLIGYVENGGIDADIDIVEDEYLIRIIFTDMVFFDTAEAVVRPEAYPVLDAVIDMFLGVPKPYTMLSIEGHTDNRSINTIRYRSNWEVSVDRATNVVAYIRDDGRLDESRLIALGMGEYHPIAPNDTPENMALNRRVEFVVETGSRGRRR